MSAVEGYQCDQCAKTVVEAYGREGHMRLPQPKSGFFVSVAWKNDHSPWWFCTRQCAVRYLETQYGEGV